MEDRQLPGYHRRRVRTKLYLKYECRVATGLYWADVSEGSINLDSANNIQVYFRSLTEEERSPEIRSDASFCRVTCEADASAKVVEGLSNYNEARSMWNKLPAELREFANRWSLQLNDYVRLAVSTLRWRFALAGPHNPVVAAGATQWSLDGANWRQFPQELRLYGMAAQRVPPTSPYVDAVEDLIQRNEREPVAHELLREARDHQFTSPRSALIVGVAAAEVGIKAYISRLVPEAAWIMDEVPSPPIWKILSKYVPSLTPKRTFAGKPVVIPKRLRTIVQNAVDLRNDLVHSNAAPPAIDKVVEALDAVQDLLWLLDHHAGFDWAQQFISHKTREELGLS